MKWNKVEDGLPDRKGVFISVDMREGAKSLKWHTLNSPWSLGEGPITHWAEIELPGEEKKDGGPQVGLMSEIDAAIVHAIDPEGEFSTVNPAATGVPSDVKTATQLQQEMRSDGGVQWIDQEQLVKEVADNRRRIEELKAKAGRDFEHWRQETAKNGQMTVMMKRILAHPFLQFEPNIADGKVGIPINLEGPSSSDHQPICDISGITGKDWSDKELWGWAKVCSPNVDIVAGSDTRQVEPGYYLTWKYMPIIRVSKEQYEAFQSMWGVSDI